MFEGLREESLPAALEALLFVTDEPVNAIALAQMLEVDVAAVQAALEALRDSLETQNRGIKLMQVAGGWRLCTHPSFHELLEHYVLSWDTRKLSAAALEVLSIVAYLQPVTRSRIADLRGVTSDGPLNTLIERGYVREAGTADTPGNPTLYATTRTFLEKYGLNSVKDLPDLEGFAPDEAMAKLIRERLGAPEAAGAALAPEDLPSPEQLAADAQAALAGVVEKIDFDKLTFNTDDE